MVCEKCGSCNIFIVNSRTAPNNTTRRRRKCECGHKWTTYELSSHEIKRLNKIYEHLKKIGEQNGE